MTKREVSNKVYVKSNNDSKVIKARYTYALIIFTVISLLINLLIGNEIISYLKYLLLSLLVTLVVTYIINIIKKEKDLKRIFLEDDGIAIGLILGLVPSGNIFILIFAIIVTLIIKNTLKNTRLSSTIYGILIIAGYVAFMDASYNINIDTPLTYVRQMNYDLTLSELLTKKDILNYLFGLTHLAPLLSLGIFIYLFNKKSIKYNIVIYYILTIFLMILIFGLIKGVPWLTFLEMASNGLIFLAIYILSDYENSPTIPEACMLYGIILGIITVILKFIVPNFAIIFAMIIGGLLLVKSLDKISYKLKYDKKIANILTIGSIIIAIITSIVLTFIF